MNVREALAVFELADGVSIDVVRATYRRLLRAHHPDLAGAGATAHVYTARLIEAYEALIAHATNHGAASVVLEPHERPAPPPPRRTGEDGTRSGETSSRRPTRSTTWARVSEPDVDLGGARALDEDSIAVAAPPPETYAALYEAASRIGEIAYYDRQLGILETIVRFEGGPSCSVLMTLQGRAEFTEVFCAIESIEAVPAPPIRPVIDALVDELEKL